MTCPLSLSPIHPLPPGLTQHLIQQTIGNLEILTLDNLMLFFWSDAKSSIRVDFFDQKTGVFGSKNDVLSPFQRIFKMENGKECP